MGGLVFRDLIVEAFIRLRQVPSMYDCAKSWNEVLFSDLEDLPEPTPKRLYILCNHTIRMYYVSKFV